MSVHVFFNQIIKKTRLNMHIAMAGELPRENPGHQLPLLRRHHHRAGLRGDGSALCGRSRLYVTQGIAGEQNTWWICCKKCPCQLCMLLNLLKR